MIKGQISESFSLFEKHYKAFKGKVNYSESRIAFEVLLIIGISLIFVIYYIRNIDGDLNIIGISL